MINKTMMTDFYELTMASTYFNEGKKDEIVYFDVFFRNNPFEGGYTISGGLDETINYIKNFKYDKESISSEYLYEIWQADRQEIIQIDSGTIYSNDGGQGTVYLTEYNGQRYLITGMNDSEYYHYYHGYMGGDFGVVQETSIQEDENGNRTYKTGSAASDWRSRKTHWNSL